MQANKDSSHIVLLATHDIMKGTPTHDTSLKWLKVAALHKSTLIPSRKLLIPRKVLETKLLTSLKAIFPVNPVNSQFCGYTILKTFAP